MPHGDDPGRRCGLSSKNAALLKTWWEFDQAKATGFDAAYHWFNLLEGAAWCLLGAVVLARYLRHRKSGLEIVYAAAFVAFGLTDFREAYELSTWLIAAKVLNLAALIGLRGYVLRRFYPAKRTF
jgi:hypothetical protein